MVDLIDYETFMPIEMVEIVVEMLISFQSAFTF